MHAIILAGGFGTRLKTSIGEEIPKPMAPIAGEPFLAHFIRYLISHGVQRVTLSVYHLKDSIITYFGDAFEGVIIDYVQEDIPLGTGGAVRFALQQTGATAPVIVTNGDSFVHIDYRAMRDAHIHARTTLSIALAKMPDCSRYGEVIFNNAHTITDFQYPGRAQPGWISTGNYIVSPDIFGRVELPEQFSFEADFQRPYCADIAALAWQTTGNFIDIGVPADYQRAQEMLIDMMKERRAA